MNSPLVIRTSTITLFFALGVAGCSGQESTSCADAQPAPSGAAASDTAADGFPRTATGKPDFSGTYDVTTLTPYSRDPRLADRLFFTDEEVREREKRVHDLVVKGLAGSDPDRDAPEALTGEARDRGVDGPPPDAPYRIGSHDLFWFDCGGQFCNLFKIDGKYPTSILIDPPNGRFPPMTESAARRAAATNAKIVRGDNDGTAFWLDSDEAGPFDGPESLLAQERCIVGFTGAAPTLPSGYNNYKTIVQTEDHVMILIEMVHDARVVRTKSERRAVEHLPSEIKKWAGDSIGWWEGDTLVVDTTNFHPDAFLLGGSTEMHVVERFTKLEDGDVLYRFTVDDPSSWTAPWTGEYVLRSTTDRVFE